MTILAVAVPLAVLAGCLALLCHPLLRFLRVSEVPAALLACAAGRLNRRRLAFILRSRRQVYLDDIACLPPEYLLVVLAWNSAVAWVRRQLVPGPLREKAPAVARHHAPALAPEKRLAPGTIAAGYLSAGSVSARGIGPCPVMSEAVRPHADVLKESAGYYCQVQSEIHDGHGRFL